MQGTQRKNSVNESCPLDSAAPGQPQVPAPPPAVHVIRSDELLRGEKEVLIEHQGSVYRLRQTRNGKLILHK
jgi:hemin uptake protein HemP